MHTKKIENGFANFKADQWKNWFVLNQSIVAVSILYGLYLYKHVQCSALVQFHMNRLAHQYCFIVEQEFGKDKVS